MRLFSRLSQSLAVCALAALTLVVAVGCSSSSGGSSQTTAADAGGQSAAPKPTTIDIISVGDKLTIDLTDIPNPYIGIQQTVRDDGTISLPLDVTVKAAGKRKADLEKDIRDQYVPRLFKRLTVSVKTEDRMFYVKGDVRKPDRYMYVGELTVLKAVAIAGGFTDFALRTKVTVTRPDGTKLTIDCKKAEKDARLDIPIYPGDTIDVPKKTLPWQ